MCAEMRSVPAARDLDREAALLHELHVSGDGVGVISVSIGYMVKQPYYMSFM